MTPETIQQYACVGFFLVSAGFVALITARVVLINGPERWDKSYDEFDDGRPLSLTLLLVNDKGQREWAALLLSQLPNGFVYLYLTWNAISSGVPVGDVFFGLLIGSALAVVLWWVANAWYYLTYEPVRASEKVEFQQNAARTLLFPRPLFGLAKPGDPFDQEPKTLEAASSWLKASPLSRWLRWLAGLLNTPGYVDPEGHIYEGHVFSALAALVILGIYLLLWPMAAPVPAFRWSLCALGLLGLVAAVLVWLLWKDDSAARVKALRAWKIGLTGAVAAFVASIALLYLLTNAERFPILATILIVAMALCWALCGISFFFDRYRLPVVTLVLVLTIAPRLMHWIELSTGIRAWPGEMGRKSTIFPRPRQSPKQLCSYPQGHPAGSARCKRRSARRLGAGPSLDHCDRDRRRPARVGMDGRGSGKVGRDL